MRRDEGWLLAAIGAVLTTAVVSLPFVDSGEPGRSAAGPSATPTPSVTPSPTPVALSVSGVRITTYAQGSKQLTISVTVVGGRDPVLQVGPRLVVLHQVGDQVTGTVPLDCGKGVPELVLELTDATGEVQTRTLSVPRAVWSSACSTPFTGPGPKPSSTFKGS